ncbi:MAG: aromatic amino acid lyase [Candidatus Coatesbacteria bacterium]|nr:MAG: aromatic amino acid lyase [Candidatus Coatesbacteria bacterium]
MTVKLDGKSLDIESVVKVARDDESVEVADAAWKRIDKCRAMLDKKVETMEVMYGVNTGIGELSEVALTADQLKDFQRYLVYSHSAGCGDPIDVEESRAAMASRINVLCIGFSGIRAKVVETLVEMLNKGVTPVVFRHGSVGACGDLSPMSQIALVLIGEGEAFYKGERMGGKEAMDAAGVPTIAFEARDGLATINGSNVIAGMGSLQLYDAYRWLKTQEVIAAMTFEVLNLTTKCLDERLHKGRGYPGAVKCASNLRRLIEDSEMLEPGKIGKKKVQNAYSLRSTPQVVGSARDAFDWGRYIFEIELNGAGDNPLFFPDDDEVVTGANFQGTPLAFALELMGTAVTTVGVLSERRINRMMNPNLSEGLPAFLIRGAGMFSGLMLTQYTAGMLCAENRVLSHPAATGSIPAAADQEDFVSMGMTTAIKSKQIIRNAWYIIAIELIAACQAMDHRRPLKGSPVAEAIYGLVREGVDFMEEDRPTQYDVNWTAELVRSGRVLEVAEKVVGELE